MKKILMKDAARHRASQRPSPFEKGRPRGILSTIFPHLSAMEMCPHIREGFYQRFFQNLPRCLGLACLLVIFSSCGAGNKPSSGTGLVLNVKNLKNLSASEWAMPEKYQIVVTASDMEELTFEFSGDTKEVLLDVPAGKDRQVVVKAVNASGSNVRIGEAADIDLGGGEVKDVDVDMVAVPGFAFLEDGKSLENTRLVLHLFSDPGDDLEVTIDGAVVGSNLIVPEEGILRFAPVLQNQGAHLIAVKSVSSGRGSELNLTLTDGTKARPATLFSGGMTKGVGGTSWVGAKQKSGEFSISPK